MDTRNYHYSERLLSMNVISSSVDSAFDAAINTSGFVHNSLRLFVIYRRANLARTDLSIE